MIQKFHLNQGQLIGTDDMDSLVHVYVLPNEEERKYLAEQYLLDEHTLLSALDPDESSRFEVEPNHIAIIFKEPKNYSSEQKLALQVTSVGLFMFKDRLIVVHSGNFNELFENRYYSKMNNLQEVLLKVFNFCIRHFFSHLKILMMIIDEIEVKINKSMDNKHIVSLFSLEKSLVYYLESIDSNGSLLEKVKNNASKLGFSSEHLELLDDLVIENSQCYKQAKIYSNILSSMMDARVSIVNNNLNLNMKRLTIFMIALMVSNLVVSLFSMNVELPIKDIPNIFWYILIFSVLTMTAFLIFGRSNNNIKHK